MWKDRTHPRARPLDEERASGSETLAGVAQDLAREPFGDLGVTGNGDVLARAWVLVDRVPAALPYEHRSELDDPPNELLALHALAAARRARVGSWLLYAAMSSASASSKFRYASAFVRPWLYAPATAGIDATHHRPDRS